MPPGGVLTRGSVVVAAKLVRPRGFLDLIGRCHGHLLGRAENRNEITGPGMQRSPLDASAAPGVRALRKCSAA
jgi:hypothetical protein